LQSFDDIFTILCKEEEAATLSTIIVLFALVGFENLETVILGIE
jgi:hypothetical protein